MGRLTSPGSHVGSRNHEGLSVVLVVCPSAEIFKQFTAFIELTETNHWPVVTPSSCIRERVERGIVHDLVHLVGACQLDVEVDRRIPRP